MNYFLEIFLVYPVEICDRICSATEKTKQQIIRRSSNSRSKQLLYSSAEECTSYFEVYVEFAQVET